MLQTTRTLILAALLLLPTALHSQWLVNNGPGAREFNGMCGHDSVLLVATEAGVFRSQDGGNLWTAELNGFYGGAALCIVRNATSVFAAGALGGLYRTESDGDDWVLSGLLTEMVRCVAVAGVQVVAGTDRHGVYVSSDNGVHWTASGLTAKMVVAVAVQGTRIVAATASDGTWLSEDSGLHFRQVRSAGSSSLLSVCLSDSCIYLGSSFIQLVSTDLGKTWHTVQDQLSTQSVYCFLDRGDTVFAGAEYGVYFTTTKGWNWLKWAPQSDTSVQRIVALHGFQSAALTRVLSRFQGVQSTTDRGQHWLAMNNNMLLSAINCFASRNATVCAGTARNGMLLSDDYMKSWTSANSVLTDIGIRAMDARGEDVIAVSPNGLLRSRSDTKNWFPMPVKGSDKTLRAVLMTTGYIMVAGDSGISVSNDDGITWSYRNSGLPALLFSAFLTHLRQSM